LNFADWSGLPVSDRVRSKLRALPARKLSRPRNSYWPKAWAMNRLSKENSSLWVPTVIVWSPASQVRSSVISRMSWSSAFLVEKGSVPALTWEPSSRITLTAGNARAPERRSLIVW
jgi:hypothetical protein